MLLKYFKVLALCAITMVSTQPVVIRDYSNKTNGTIYQGDLSKYNPYIFDPNFPTHRNESGLVISRFGWAQCMGAAVTLGAAANYVYSSLKDIKNMYLKDFTYQCLELNMGGKFWKLEVFTRIDGGGRNKKEAGAVLDEAIESFNYHEYCACVGDGDGVELTDNKNKNTYEFLFSMEGSATGCKKTPAEARACFGQM
ncbi:unnamed protein product [Cunninghamella blakesleeana]